MKSLSKIESANLSKILKQNTYRFNHLMLMKTQLNLLIKK